MPRAISALLVLLTLSVAATARAAHAPETGAGIVDRLEAAVASGRPETLEPLLAPTVDRAAVDEFTARWIRPGTTRVAARARERLTSDGGPERLTIEALIEAGPSARLATWQIDVRPETGEGGEPLIVGLKTLSGLDGLYRLAVDATRQYKVHDLRIAGEDLVLTVPRGTLFTVPTPDGVTAVVVLGRGVMTFHPTPETERGQVRLFAGEETLKTPFDGALIKLHPSQYESVIDQAALSSVPVEPKALRNAEELFREEAPKSYSVDLADLSDGTWWLLPSMADMLAEVRTKRFGTLTYGRATNEAEDVTLFDRDRRRNISIYASRSRLATRGPFYSEDELVDYDVQDYALDLAYVPERNTFQGRAQLKLRVRASAISTLNLKLAASLQVQAVTTDLFGRVLFLRVRNQDSLVVNLPSLLTKDTVFTLAVAYAGALGPQRIDTEATTTGQQEPVRRLEDAPLIQPERSYLYSNRSYWYPQPPVSDYATATMRITVPTGVGAVCSGDKATGSPVSLRARGDDRQLYLFVASQPVRYLGCIFGRFVEGDAAVVSVAGTEAHADGGSPSPGGAAAESGRLAITTMLMPRQQSRGKGLLERTVDIAEFYGGVMHDVPYPSFTLAVLESYLPGGHSPAYFAALNQPLPATPFRWREDPANFDDFPEFFLAHELAHQWWGQAVGWQNYHEQWLSEGFAQYFAALYAERRRGPDTFAGIIRSMQRWALDESDQGPVYLGYRLGHLKNDGRIMRALVYNKGALVLHMLRRLVGDDTFFRALRRFYREHRFQKAGTDDLRKAFAAESGRDFGRFFEQWIYGSTIPAIRWTTKTEGEGDGQALLIRIEQQRDRVFDFPVTVTLHMTDGSSKDVTVVVTDKVTEQQVPFTGALKSVQVNRDRATLLKDDS